MCPPVRDVPRLEPSARVRSAYSAARYREAEEARDMSYGHGIEITGAIKDRFDEILTPEAVAWSLRSSAS